MPPDSTLEATRGGYTVPKYGIETLFPRGLLVEPAQGIIDRIIDFPNP